MTTLTKVRETIRTILHDRFTGLPLSWTDQQLDACIFNCLTELSTYSPHEVRRTLTTTAGSKDIDIQTLTNFIRLDPTFQIEYPIGTHRNASIFGGILTMLVDSVPGAGESVHLYCLEYHTLTDLTSTLNDEQERVLILGATGNAALFKSVAVIDDINKGGPRVPADFTVWGQMQLALYRDALNGLVKPRPYKAYRTC